MFACPAALVSCRPPLARFRLRQNGLAGATPEGNPGWLDLDARLFREGRQETKRAAEAAKIP